MLYYLMTGAYHGVVELGNMRELLATMTVLLEEV